MAAVAASRRPEDAVPRSVPPTLTSDLSPAHVSPLVLAPPAGGFYSQQVEPGLRVVSLNTILYYGPNHATANATDPAGQFDWLETTLQEAGRSLEKVGGLQPRPQAPPSVLTRPNPDP